MRLDELGHLAQPVEAVAAPGRAVDDEAVRAGQQVARRPGWSNGGSPGHQTVTGRSWMISGVAIADEVPARPRRRTVTWIVSAQVSGASSRGSTQCASTRASSHDGPSGSADRMTIVRDGCRPVSAWIVAAQRSASSGRRATTTRFITLVRAGDVAARLAVDRRPSGPGSPRSGRARVSISAMLWARADQRRTGSPIVVGVVDRSSPRSDPAPAPAVAGEQLVGRRRPPRPGVVVREVGRRARRPRRR